MTRRVLVIDDETDACNLVAAFLEPLGYGILVAESGEAGLARLSLLADIFGGSR